ncbi:unnamed protein product [Protopolystoma xenopodis]|uniref:Amino acid permease/ SLC12A domain-containing protein n=1 Tax=Protopolystoma xenopodis TaxID=117903 RepID=A0A448W9V6_9PLAT|nr:unnamed protein product [Protopolystoma xenopodis]
MQVPLSSCSISSPHSSPTHSPASLAKVLTTYDLVQLGIGSILGAGLYVVTGDVAMNRTGPAIILAFLIAAIASLFSGLCYAEFGSRVPQTTGSAYTYSYRTVGELIAFVIGWNMVMEYMIGSAADARALSAAIDYLAGHRVKTWTESSYGRLPWSSAPSTGTAGRDARPGSQVKKRSERRIGRRTTRIGARILIRSTFECHLHELSYAIKISLTMLF